MTPMTVSDRLARFNRRVPNRIIGTIAGRRLSPVAFMVHQGRKSGRRYRTPVMPLPLGVTRVLVGDLAQQGMVTVHRAPSHAGGPNVALLEQVLHGLQQL